MRSPDNVVGVEHDDGAGPGGLPAAVLWDLDGTLIDTEPYWIAAEFNLVAEYGGVWTDDDAHSIIGFDLLDAAEELRRRGHVELTPQEIVDRLVAEVVAGLEERMPWRPGAAELLRSLGAAGVPCALVTMSWRPVADAFLRYVPPDTFQAVITGDEVRNGKPHPEPYLRAADALGVDPVACVAIEDSPTGIRAAEAAGCVVVAVPNMIAIPDAPDRTVLPTLDGVTPRRLGEIVEATPPPAPAGTPSGGLQQGVGIEPKLIGALAAVMLLLFTGFGVWWFTIRDTSPPWDPGAFNVHTWAPYWELEDSLPYLDDNYNMFHQVSPFWYAATGVTSITFASEVTDEDEELIDDFLSTARSRGVPLVASIIDETDSGVMADILGNPDSRAEHIDAIVAFARQHDFDGIDLDYEQFAFADPKATWETTRPAWVTFIEELSTRLHADGRQLVVSVPWVLDDERTDDSGYWVYDIGAIVDHVDAIRIMAYDYSTDRAGPIAPLEWVEEIIAGTTEAAGSPEKLVLGIPMYGRNWVLRTEGECPESAVTSTQGVQLDSVADLAARRDAVPVFDPTTGESSFQYQLTYTDGDLECTQTRQVNFVDAEGIRIRMQMSIDAGMLGVSLFAMGHESDAVYDDIAAINATLSATEPPAAG